MNLKDLKNVDYKALAIQYCDKVAVAVASCLLVWFLLLGVQKARSTAKISPEEITTLANNLRTKVEKSQFNAAGEKIVNPDYSDVARSLTTKIDLADYKWSQPFMKFLDFGAILRQQPEILSPYGPRVHADRGAVY